MTIDSFIRKSLVGKTINGYKVMEVTALCGRNIITFECPKCQKTHGSLILG